jgi:hypothetical protein
VNYLINVHQEIIPGLRSGWFHSRCPRANSGCAFASENMAPNSEKIRLRFFVAGWLMKGRSQTMLSKISNIRTHMLERIKEKNLHLTYLSYQ